MEEFHGSLKNHVIFYFSRPRFPKGEGRQFKSFGGQNLQGGERGEGGKLKKGINFYTRYPGVAD